MPDEKRTSTDFCGKVFIGHLGSATFGLVICGLAGLGGASLRFIMNSLGKKDGRVYGHQYATGVA